MQWKFKGLVSFVFPAIAFVCTGTFPHELREANAAPALGPSERRRSSLVLLRIIHSFWSILADPHARHRLSPFMFLPHKIEVFLLCCIKWIWNLLRFTLKLSGILVSLLKKEIKFKVFIDILKMLQRKNKNNFCCCCFVGCTEHVCVISIL